MKALQTVLATMILGGALAAQATPITYTMVVDSVTGTANGVGVGPGATTTIVIGADTANITSVSGTRKCVKGDSGTIAITGINGGAAQSLSGNFYVCANTGGDNVGVYGAADVGNSPVHGGNSGGGTGALTGSPAMDLASNIGPVTYVAASIHSHSTALSLVAGGTYAANRPENGIGPNTTASSFKAELGASAFIPPLPYAPYTLGVGLPTALDMSGGSGPSVSNCLIPAIQQLLGGTAAYAGQNRLGQASVLWNGQSLSFFPVNANATSSNPPTLRLQSDNPLAIVTTCGTLYAVPAPFDLTLFGSTLNAMGLLASIDQKGVIALRMGGVVYVGRPDFVVTAGSTLPVGLSRGTDGLFKLTNATGNSQVFRTAFLDPAALASAMGGTVTVQTDGTAILSANGQRWTLVADQTLADVPFDHANDFTAWADGGNRLRYRIQNVKPFPLDLFQFTYSQGFTRTAMP